MPVLTAQDNAVTSATIAASGNLSGAIDMRRFTRLLVHMPSAWTAASIGFKVAPSNGGTYQILYDDNGDLLQIDSAAASKSYAAPAGIAGAGWVKLWSQNGSGTNTAQAAARTLTLELKT